MDERTARATTDTNHFAVSLQIQKAEGLQPIFDRLPLLIIALGHQVGSGNGVLHIDSIVGSAALKGLRERRLLVWPRDPPVFPDSI